MSVTGSAELEQTTLQASGGVWSGAPRLQTIVQIPTPGDHYSPATGSAIVTIIYEIARVHAAHGGTTRVVVSRGTRSGYHIGERCEVEPTAPPPRWLKVVDVALGRIGLGRPFGARAYRPHVSAIPRDYHGLILIHNNPVAIPMFKRLFPKAIVCLWANNELWGTYSDREVDRIAASADRLICCSDFIAQGTRARLAPRWHGKVRVVHNGVDIDRFQPADRLPVDPPVILFIGRVIEPKGPDLLIRAAAALGAAAGPFRVRIVGSAGFTAAGTLSPYEQRLRELAAPLGNRVEFVPFRDRKAVLEEYRRGSIFCVPSNWDDPCPLTVLEGMACGLPIVASRRGGIPEEVGDAGLLFDSADVGGLAEHLRRLVADADERAVLGRRSRFQAERFAWERQYESLVDAIGPAPSEEGTGT